jgi:hypothetical protein
MLGIPLLFHIRRLTVEYLPVNITTKNEKNMDMYKEIQGARLANIMVGNYQKKRNTGIC